MSEKINIRFSPDADLPGVGSTSVNQEPKTPEKEVVLTPEQELLKQKLIDGLPKENYYNLLDKIKKDFNLKDLPDSVIKDVNLKKIAMEEFRGILMRGFAIQALDVSQEFQLPIEEVYAYAKQIFLDFLSDRINLSALGTDTIMTNIDTALEVYDEFKLTDIGLDSKEIINKIPGLEDFLEKIKDVFPNFYSQVLSSPDTLINFAKFRDKPEIFIGTIKENPFLVKAIESNPRYAAKLILKYPEFDKLSKENIALLFNTKEELLHINPDLDTNSVEFRQLMQERLKTHKNNPEILKAIEASGINVEQWLNYGEVRYFQLESGKSNLAFSETVATPLDRIKETLDSYSNRIKEVLLQYRVELAGAKIQLEKPAEIQERIAKMQEEMVKAQVEQNDKKAAGIQRGIDSLTMRMGNIKTISLWDKVVGDIGAFQGLKNDVFSAQERLIETERQFAEKVSAKTPSGKEIEDLKQKITKAKDELRTKFGLLERRIEDFQNNLPGFLLPSLGEDRTKALLQEIQIGLEEQFDHYRTDRSTLANLFSERTDREKEKMEGQPLSIFVWARNPDIDLYQANYSPCCISIESGCASNPSESAIADYNTDLGIQIVNIWNETKNEPVTAAWCWLGKDEKGSAALVVDNIESNSMYSINYPEQLTEELFVFLKNYAKSIGVDRLVLGKDNNDLPTGGELAKLPNNNKTYEKTGGFNREDGYYLEAIDESVKLLWQKKKKLKKKEKKNKTVKFKN